MSFSSDPQWSDLDTEGAHLCAPGLYREFVKRLLNKYPNLRFNDLTESEIKFSGAIAPQAKAVSLCLHPYKNAVRRDFTDAGALRRYLQQQGDLLENSKRRNLLFVEGYHPEYISIIGEHFGISPVFFSRHRRAAYWESWHDSGNTPCLASTRDDKDSFFLDYHELLFLNDNIGQSSIRCADGHQTVRTCRIPGRHFDKVVRKYSRVSYWSRRNGSGYWDG